MLMRTVHEELLLEFQDFSLSSPSAKVFMGRLAHGLHEKMARYIWGGFYLPDPMDPAV